MTNKKINWVDGADLDLPFLVLPGKGETVTIGILKAPKEYTKDGVKFIGARCERWLNDDVPNSMVFAPEEILKFNSGIYKGMIAQLKKNNIVVDKDLNCVVDLVFKIEGKQWLTAPEELWKDGIAPTIHSIELRT